MQILCNSWPIVPPNGHALLHKDEGMNLGSTRRSLVMATISKKKQREKFIPMFICLLPLTSSDEPGQAVLSLQLASRSSHVYYWKL